MNVISAKKPSPRVLPLHDTGEFTLGRNPMNAMSVGKLSMIPQPLGVMGELTSQRSPMTVVSVEMPSGPSPP